MSSSEDSIDLDKDDLHTVRTAGCFSMPLGGDRLKEQIEAALGQCIG